MAEMKIERAKLLMCIIVPMNTQHTEPSSWLFTSNNTITPPTSTSLTRTCIIHLCIIHAYAHIHITNNNTREHA